MMREKIYLLFFFILILSAEITLAKNGNKTKLAKGLKKHNSSIKQSSGGRTKRSLNIDDVKTYSSNIGTDFGMKLDALGKNEENLKKFVIDKEPFWGTRGRRDSSEENFIGRDLFNHILSKGNRCFGINYKDCSKTVNNLDDFNEYLNEKREDDSPFWGNHGRRYPDETENDDHDSQAPFWSIRGRRQENDPFWGTRGRRQDDSPFWGNRGRREDVPFWSQRGRREEAESFWGNHGRRVDNDLFWGTRGRRQESEPFWGNRVKKQGYNSFANTNGKEIKDLKGYIRDAINIVEHNIENVASEIPVQSFWKNRGRESQLKFMFNGGRLINQKKPNSKFSNTHSFVNPSESRTMLDNRIYADEPHFILVERSSRSSSEDDPFFISRGKKKFVNFQLAEAARDRRGSVEELVKSVRNDPYYIARGKKDLNKILKLGNSTLLREKLQKAKDLICSTLDLLTIKSEQNNVKREVDDNDRDRRTILKKLTAQLQNDPYFVSRGKKNDKSRINDDNLEYFISEVSEKCY